MTQKTLTVKSLKPKRIKIYFFFNIFCTVEIKTKKIRLWQTEFKFCRMQFYVEREMCKSLIKNQT
jgi:hypothetical protein